MQVKCHIKRHIMMRPSLRAGEADKREADKRVGDMEIAAFSGGEFVLSAVAVRCSVTMSSHLTRADAEWLRDALNALLVAPEEE